MNCHSQLCGIYFVGVDESVDGAALLDLSEGDVKMMVKPLGHVKRVLRLTSNIKTKVMMRFPMVFILLCNYGKLCQQVIPYLLIR